MSFSKRFAGAFISVILLFSFWSMSFYQPKTIQIEQSRNRALELTQQLATLSNMEMSISEFEEKVDSLQMAFDRDNALLADRNRLNERITDITNVALGLEINVNIVNPSTVNLLPVSIVSQHRHLGYIIEKNALMIQLTGKYVNVGRFLEQVKEMEGIYIERVELISDPMVYPDLNVFAYLFIYSKTGNQV